MKKILFLMLFSFFFILGMSADTKHPLELIYIDNQDCRWEYLFSSEELSFSDIILHSKWEKYSSPAVPLVKPLDQNKILWVRFLLPFAESEYNLFSNLIISDFQTFINGKEVFRSDNIAPKIKNKDTYWRNQIFFIPVTAQGQYIYYRIVSNTANIGFSGYTVIGKKLDILRKIITFDLDSLIIALILLLCGISFILFSFIRKQFRAKLLFSGTFLFLLAFRILFQTNSLSYILQNSLIKNVLNDFILYLLPISAIFLVRSFFKKKFFLFKAKFILPFSIISLIFAVINFIDLIDFPVLIKVRSYFNFFWYVFILFVISAIISYIFFICDKNFSQTCFCYGIFFISIFIVYEILGGVGFISWHRTYLQWGALLFSLILIVLLLHEMTRENMRLKQKLDRAVTENKNLMEVYYLQTQKANSLKSVINDYSKEISNYMDTFKLEKSEKYTLTLIRNFIESVSQTSEEDASDDLYGFSHLKELSAIIANIRRHNKKIFQERLVFFFLKVDSPMIIKKESWVLINFLNLLLLKLSDFIYDCNVNISFGESSVNSEVLFSLPLKNITKQSELMISLNQKIDLFSAKIIHSFSSRASSNDTLEISVVFNPDILVPINFYDYRKSYYLRNNKYFNISVLHGDNLDCTVADLLEAEGYSVTIHESLEKLFYNINFSGKDIFIFICHTTDTVKKIISSTRIGLKDNFTFLITSQTILSGLTVSESLFFDEIFVQPISVEELIIKIISYSCLSQQNVRKEEKLSLSDITHNNRFSAILSTMPSIYRIDRHDIALEASFHISKEVEHILATENTSKFKKILNLYSSFFSDQTESDTAIRSSLKILQEIKKLPLLKNTPFILSGKDFNSGINTLNAFTELFSMHEKILNNAFNYNSNLLVSSDIFLSLNDPLKYSFRIADIFYEPSTKNFSILFDFYDFDEPDIKNLKNASKYFFEKAWNSYINYDFLSCRKFISDAYSIYPDDALLKLYSKRCEYFMSFPTKNLSQLFEIF